VRLPTITRSSALGRLALTGYSLATTGCSDGGAVTPIATQLGWLKNAEWAGVYVAESQGFFSKEKISSRLLSGGPNAISVPQAIGGGIARFGLAVNLAEVASAVKAGSDLVVLGCIYQRGLACIISLPGKSIRTLGDLVGKRIGAYNPGVQQAFFDSIGLHGVQVVKSSVSIDTLLDGDIDALIGVASDQGVALRLRGIKPVLLPFESMGWHDYMAPVVTNRATLRKERPLVRAYLRALIKGHELNIHNPSLASRLISENPAEGQSMDFSAALMSNQTFIQQETSALTKRKGLLWMDIERVQGPVYRAYAVTGLTGLPPASSYIDLSVLAEAYGPQNHLLRFAHA
jgi:ABC-type nitrate/sulfonate/bicarbonate transport system substrate-binding protein